VDTLLYTIPYTITYRSNIIDVNADEYYFEFAVSSLENLQAFVDPFTSISSVVLDVNKLISYHISLNPCT